MRNIRIEIPNKEYNVHVEYDLLSRIDQFVDVTCEIVIITDDFMPKIYLEMLKSKILNPLVIEVPMGESSKSINTSYSIINTMISNGITRNCLVIALGGGVIGDLAGFVASVYFRGVDFIQIPTTLLSQIDSSVGGKVGINAENMKNAIGSFYQPKMVLVDPKTLETLSEREKNNGIAEMIKYGLISDEELFNDLCNKNIWDNIEYYISKCIEIKRSYVINDERDNGLRQILNFGHTIGHAIEQDSKYTLLHGEAVAIGMLKISKGSSYYKTLEQCLQKYNLMKSYDYQIDTILNIIKTDKKAQSNKLNIILVETVGNGYIKQIETEKIKEYL